MSQDCPPPPPVREADCYAKLAGLGWSGIRIATECGLFSKKTGRPQQELVSVMVRMVRGYPLEADRPAFWHAYAEVTGERGAHVAQNAGVSEWDTPQKGNGHCQVGKTPFLLSCAACERGQHSP